MYTASKFKSKTFSKTKGSAHWSDIFKQQAIDFFSSTSLHGYKYIVQFKRPKYERYSWSVIVFLLLCGSLIAIYQAWKYNSSYPTLAIIESTHHGVWNFPFPAVTICNINQVSLTNARDFVNKLKFLRGLSREFVLKEMRMLTEMLDPGIFEYNIHFNLSVLQDIFDANNYTAAQVMKLVSQDCSRLLKNCWWRGNSLPCERLFEEVHVRDGICCSFNYFHKDMKINHKRKNAFVPEQLNACGYQTALSFEVHPEPRDYYATLFASYGVKALLHYPYNYPSRSAEFQLVGLGVQNFLSVAPEEHYSSDALKGLSLEQRECVFEGYDLPASLQALMRNYSASRYTYLNCLNVCRMTVIISECGCVPYYTPQNGSRICDLRDLTCLKKVRHIYDTSWPGTEIRSVDIPDVNIDILNRPCGCLPDCTLYVYPIDSTQGPLNKNFIQHGLMKNNDLGNFSIINVFFTDLVATRYRRNVYFTWKYLFASFGGLLGLFIGLSATTIFELLHFFVIRPIYETHMKYKKRIKLKNYFNK